ncbi:MULTISPECIES: tyrosine-type recombinase/integrase [Enterobacteriaceae]|uniref:tyrosine-type recombinase/integrase n=1 Tax=Enterobacteriaceae TaxID=543 RepID=UPI000992FC94|nr:site-specific integrase [Enterobacter kobei]OOV69145.1 integrase [Enterobacter kobei]
MTFSHEGGSAKAARPQNLPTVTPAQLWLAGLTPAGRKGMQSQLNRCADLLERGRCADDFPWHTLDYTGVMLVRSALLNEGYAVATVNMALSALKSVAGTAFSMGILDADRLTRIRSVRRIAGSGCRQGRALDRNEIRAMLAAAAKYDSVRCQRDRAIVLLLCGAGLRAAELVALDANDIDPASGIVTVRQGKGRKSREIQPAGKVLTQLRRWLKLRGDHAGPLFSRISRSGHSGASRLTTTGLTGLLVQLREAAGVDHFTPHDLRRTFITRLLEQGVDISVVRQLAGHADISTTTRYDCRGRLAADSASRRLRCW